jgi:hypothetical protein
MTIQLIISSHLRIESVACGNSKLESAKFLTIFAFGRGFLAKIERSPCQNRAFAKYLSKTQMSDFLANIQAVRDVLLLIVNAGIFVTLVVIAFLIWTRSKKLEGRSDTQAVEHLLGKHLKAQEKIASSIATSSNELKLGLGELLGSSESLETGADVPLTDFKSMRTQIRELDERVDRSIASLSESTEEHRDSLADLLGRLGDDRELDRTLSRTQHTELVASLRDQSTRREHSASALAAGEPSVPTLDLGPLENHLARANALNETLAEKIGAFSEKLAQGPESRVADSASVFRGMMEDIVAENVRQGTSMQEIQSGLRAEFRTQTDLLSRVVADLSKHLKSAPPIVQSVPGADTGGTDVNVELRSAIEKVGAQFQFPTNEFRQITDTHHATLRKLLEGFTDENIRRVHATDELRRAIQQDLKGQVDQLKTLVDQKPKPSVQRAQSTPSSATITASVANDLTEENRNWQDQVRTALAEISDRLDRMQERMEEIFQV